MAQNLYKQYATATSGTITAQDTKQDVQLIQNGASLAATLTVTFPTNPTDGQRFGISSGLGVTLMTLSASVTILGLITSMAAGSFATWMYDANSTKWFRVG